MEDNVKGHKKAEQVDEEHLMRIMSGDAPIQEAAPANNPEASITPLRETTKRKKNNSEDYMILFFKNSDSMARTGKSVYIRPEYHERLSRIVQVIGEDKVTLYAYLDNILEYHFKQFSQEITENYNQKNKPIL